TRRGLELTDRVCWVILGVAMAVAAALILYLNRGTTFFPDEIDWVYASPSLSAGDVFEPHNGHLVATTRLVYKAILETVGAEYLAFRLLGVAAVLLSAALFYALAKRRIGALPALAPAFVLLFLGSAPVHVTSPVGFTPVFSIAAGLAALLALERSDWRGDLAGCGLIIISIATYTTGLAFLGGVSISVLLRPDRARRAWIFLVPLLLYAAWWLQALSSESSASGEASPFNVVLIPNWVAESLAAVLSAITGLGYEFAEQAVTGVSVGWGRVLAVLAVVALVLRIRRGHLPPALWVSFGVVLTYWSLGALVAGSFSRVPEASRFIYPGAVGLLLVATAAAQGLRLSRLGVSVLFIAAAFSLATNIALLADGAAQTRNVRSPEARAYFTALELARGRVVPDFMFGPPQTTPIESPAAAYFEAADRYGSLAFPLPELQQQSEAVRQRADGILVSALGLRLEASSSRQGNACVRVGVQQRRGVLSFELPRRGASLRVRAPGPAALTLGRFGDLPSVEVGSLAPGQLAALRIPPDASPRPWRAAVAEAGSVEVCELR
ncbi:MAG TPA: hypothetical protein VK920_02080, partial [Solirubrobacterales bacterium]|nr:hypothetical protein [Solirubrobacterales bacterium]